MPPTRHPPGFVPDTPSGAPPGFVPQPTTFPTPLSRPGSPLFGGQGVPDTPEELFRRSHETYEATKPRTGAERLGEVLPGALSMGASMLVPPARPGAPLAARLLQGALGRIGASEGGNTLGRAVTGQGLMPTGGGAFQQTIGEILFAPMGFALKAKAAAQARQMATDKHAFDTAMNNALGTMEQAGHTAEVQALRARYAEQLRMGRAAYQTGKQRTMADYRADVTATEQRHAAAAGAHGEQSATSIMEEWKRLVPAWESLQSSNRGIVDAVLGKGQRLVGASYDAALKEVLEQATGKTVSLSPQAANAFGFKAPPDPFASLSPVARQALERAGKVPPARPEGVEVDAVDLIKRMSGQSETKPQAYRDAASTLVEAGFGNEAARAEYKAAQGLISSVDKAKAIAYVPGVGHVFNPEAQLTGMSRVKQINELRRRGLGDIFEGPMQAVRGGPVAPPERPKPVVPPYVPPPRPTMPAAPSPRVTSGLPTDTALGIRMMKNPLAHPLTLGFGAEGLSHSMGTGSMLGVPFLVGSALGGAMPKTMIMRAPLGPTAQAAQRLTPAAIGALLRFMAGSAQRPAPAPVPARPTEQE